MAFESNDAHVPASQTVEFLSVDLRLSTIVEMLIMRRDQATVQVSRCAHWYQDNARQELYPTRRSLASMTPSMRRAVAIRAIEMVIADSRSRQRRP
jgi:hypothetical protein